MLLQEEKGILSFLGNKYDIFLASQITTNLTDCRIQRNLMQSVKFVVIYDTKKIT